MRWWATRHAARSAARMPRCVLRDGRKLIGYLRSIDQFANLVLQDTIERIYVGDCYGDIDRGIYLVRGENVVLLGDAAATVAGAWASGLAEYWNPDTGAGLGAIPQSWSGLALVLAKRR